MPLRARRGLVDEEFTRESCACGTVAAGINAVAAAILAVACPRDDEVAGVVHCHGGICLCVRHVRIHGELGSCRRIRRSVVHAGVNIPVGALSRAALPDDDELAGGGGYRDIDTGVCCIGRVDLELAGHGYAVAIEITGIDVRLRVDAFHPGDDEATVRIHGDRRRDLAGSRYLTDLDLVRRGHTLAAILASPDASISAGAHARPNDDEAAVVVHRHGGRDLAARCVGIDDELVSHGLARRIISLSDNIACGRCIAIGAVADPNDDVAAVRSRSDHGAVLLAGLGGVCRRVRRAFGRGGW